MGCCLLFRRSLRCPRMRRRGSGGSRRSSRSEGAWSGLTWGSPRGIRCGCWRQTGRVVCRSSCVPATGSLTLVEQAALAGAPEGARLAVVSGSGRAGVAADCGVLRPPRPRCLPGVFVQGRGEPTDHLVGAITASSVGHGGPLRRALRSSRAARCPFGSWSSRSQRHAATIARARIRHSRSSS